MFLAHLHIFFLAVAMLLVHVRERIKFLIIGNLARHPQVTALPDRPNNLQQYLLARLSRDYAPFVTSMGNFVRKLMEDFNRIRNGQDPLSCPRGIDPRI